MLLLAGLSGVADGWAARRLGVAGGMGAAIDPIVDKLFVLPVMLTLLGRGELTPLDLALLSTRELIELPLAVWLAVSARARVARTHMSANILGKLATALQFLTVTLLLLQIAHVGAPLCTAVVGALAGCSYWQQLRAARAAHCS